VLPVASFRFPKMYGPAIAAAFPTRGVQKLGSGFDRWA
jgi:hypothetical protein